MLSASQSHCNFLRNRHRTRRQRLDSPRRRVDLCACCLALPRAICARHHLLRERDRKRFEQRNLEHRALPHHPESGQPHQTRRHRERNERDLRPLHYSARGVPKRWLHHLSGLSRTASYDLEERQRVEWHPNRVLQPRHVLHRCGRLHRPRQRPKHYGKSGAVRTRQ